MLIVGNGRVVTRDAQMPFLEHGAVAIEGDAIQSVGEEAELVAAHPGAEYIDAHGGVIMPGLVNCHTHIYSGLARGLAITGCNPHNFLENLEQQWWKIDRNLTLDGTRACAFATILESLRNGVTTIFDHHASFCEIPGSLFAIRDVAAECGIRACLCYETSDRDGEEKLAQAIAENAEFAGFHIHVCEGMNDVWDSRENRGGIPPVERLLQHGLLGPDTMLGHCIHVTPAEMDIIRETGTHVVNNPESNMGNAVGCAPVLEFFRRDIDVCMGTDAYTHDMLESLKTFLCIQRHNAAMPNVGWGEAMQMLFQDNARMASRYFGREVGVLAPGAAADVVVMDYPTFTPLLADNIDGHILFGMEGRSCRTTIVNGQVLYRDREFTTIDEQRIDAWTLEQAKVLWGTLNGRRY